jgi:uncharacterized MAPEG superfamily protein
MMTIAEWMLLAAVLLYLLTLAPAKVLGPRTFDNSKPRDPEFYKSAVRSRTLGAHINGIETFPFFAAAVLLSEFRHEPQHLIDQLTMAFVGIRLLFVAAYVGNWPTTRTLLWNLGFFINVALFLMPMWSPNT